MVYVRPGLVAGLMRHLTVQGSHGQGKVWEKCKKFKVREKSGNFEISQGNLKKWKKSGKSQGISESEEEILNSKGETSGYGSFF